MIAEFTFIDFELFIVYCLDHYLPKLLDTYHPYFCYIFYIKKSDFDEVFLVLYCLPITCK